MKPLRERMLRIGNVRKVKNSKKSIEYQLLRVHEEVSEMGMDLRKVTDLKALTKITYKNDKRGISKPHGFAAEWGDAVAQLLHIAEVVGIDPDKALEAVTDYHEQKQRAKGKKK